ncbi:MAG: OmpA family protein [Bacteroidales bacterium]|nr:OmpA family protein [Bacteroidales bacterium]
MRKIYFLSLTFFMSISLSSIAQTYVDISNTSTCEQALDISRFTIFGPTTAPVELKTAKSNSFDLTKHPTWYKFTINKDGILLFDIIPQNPKDNYDFMLFKADDNFCEKFKAKQITPIRSNFSRQENAKGLTGLSYSGAALDYEKGLMVSKGDVFYLVLNNVYKNGKGHTISFKQLKTIKISGTVVNSKNGKPIKAEIRWWNLRNNNVFVTSQTEKKGSYEIDILLNNQSNTFPKYELCVYSDNYFPEYKIYSTAEANQLNDKKIEFKLNRVKKGTNNEGLGVIYFQPNDVNIVPTSEYVKRKLLKFMTLNEQAEIVLEGHTNGLFPSTDVDFELSTDRANLIKEYLVDNGISESRIGIEGMGSKNEVYPIPETEEEEGFNRRVEINIISF